MAGALVSMVMEKIREVLVSKVMEKLGEEVSSVGGAQADLEKISSTFKSIQALLNDAEIMQFKDESMQVWLKKLKDVAYDVEDLLDEMIPWPEPESRTDDGDDRQRKGKRKWFSFLSWTDGDDTDNVMSIGDKVSRTDDGDDRQRKGKRKWLSFPSFPSWTDGDDTDNVMSIEDKVQPFVSKFASQRDFASQIKEVRAKLDQIADDKSKFSFQLNHRFRGGSELHKAEYQTSSLVDESKMLGRDGDKDIIISKLVSGSSSEEGRRIHVISIVGVGGLGKTTLARLIYNDKRVTSHFHKVLWVCVSHYFDVVRLTKAIIQDAERVNTPLTDLNPLQIKHKETLQGKRFLLVLDDVWNDDSEKWEELWLSFQSGAPGSKILVTTRSERVANTCMPSAYMHELKSLCYDDCWLLFRTRAFAGKKDVEDRLALEKIGGEIVKKCKGVPLSVKVIGSAMCSKRTAEDWQDILKSETWEIPEMVKGILPALLLSYYNLPVHLKQCFAYCSLFPKDHVMQKDKLVKLWLAQGFIKPEGKREMEAIGGEYFDDLLAQSLLQKVVLKYEEYEKDEEEEVTCTIHDLLHDLAQFITKNEYCIFETGKSNSSSVTARHSSFIVNRETSQIPPALCDAKKLRTLHQLGYSVMDTIPYNLFQCARSLRALDFGRISTSVFYYPRSSSLRIKKLPSSIGLLKHLRYLNLSYSMIVELPESVTHLCNLQTLKLNGCVYLQRLPSGMSAMVRLRHLEIKDSLALKYLPEGLGGISSLRTLSRFMVGGHGGCKIGELKRLNSLQGKLVIENLERVGNGDEAKEAELYNKLHLRVLYLQMSPDDDHFEMSKIDEVSPDDDLKMSRDYEILSKIDNEVSPVDDLEMSRETWSKFIDELWSDDDLEMSSDYDLDLLGDDKVERMNDVLEALQPQVERMNDVLEALQPPDTNLKKLVIERYIGSKFPNWMEDLPFSNLVDLRLKDCYKCTQLPGLGRLPSLKCLQIEGGLIKRVGHEFYRNSCGGGKNGVAFPKLEKLRFSRMNELEEWDLRLEDGEIMPSLQTLDVHYCPKLKALPTHLPKSLTSLKTLIISFCHELRSLPDDLGQLKSLRSLEICGCPALWSLPQGLQGVPHLEIKYSPMQAKKCRWEDLSNISHIPNIRINGKEIERGADRR